MPHFVYIPGMAAILFIFFLMEMEKTEIWGTGEVGGGTKMSGGRQNCSQVVM